jgi:hypothetical protein
MQGTADNPTLLIKIEDRSVRFYVRDLLRVTIFVSVLVFGADARIRLQQRPGGVIARINNSWDLRQRDPQLRSTAPD